jgi:hypothetical protein
MRGRITFIGNPWPAGHRLTRLEIGGELHPRHGLRLHLQLESADYDEDDGDDVPDDPDGVDNWASRIVWTNYHTASIGPSQTNDLAGFAPPLPFDVDAPRHHFRVDPLPCIASDIFDRGAFSCYVQGHDAVADHDIMLTRTGPGRFSVRWTGKVAEAYRGHEDFIHDFVVEAEDVPFVGIGLWGFEPARALEYHGVTIDPGATPASFLAPFVVDVGRYDFTRGSHWMARLRP